METIIPFRERVFLWTQRWISFCFIIPLYWIIWAWMFAIRRYKIIDHRQVRKQFTRIVKEHWGPFVICANHLTLIDSMIIIWALLPWWRCFVFPRLMPWDVPEHSNFYTRFWLKGICFLGKCIPVMRRGPREKNAKAMAKIEHLLSIGQSLLIFPEGGRSRTGRLDVDGITYGAGALLLARPEAKLISIYCRGVTQEAYSNFPKAGEAFFLTVKVSDVQAERTGLRGARDIAAQITESLIELEAEYDAYVEQHRK